MQRLMPNSLPPIHPGETLREDVLDPMNMSVNQLAKALGVDSARLNEIVRGRRGITADTALRLARYLGTGILEQFRPHLPRPHPSY
jgi:addiction module HigA family antidote